MSALDAIDKKRSCMTVFAKVDLDRFRHPIHHGETKFKYLKYFLSF